MKQGCNWCSFADKEDSLTGEVDKITFKRFAKIAREQPELCEMIPFYAIWNGDKPDGGDPWYKNLVPDVSRYRLRYCLVCDADSVAVQASWAIDTQTGR